MKMFVWIDPYGVSYGGCSVVAVADTVEEARAIAASSSNSFSFGRFKKENPGVELKEPTHVFDVPCAMWDMYQE